MKNKMQRLLCILLMVVIIAAIAVTAISAYGNYRMKKIPDMSFEETLRYTAAGNADAVITIGIIKDGAASFTVYGEDGEILPEELHTYEIGSLTKTFTAALVMRAVNDEKINLDDKIDSYLPLKEQENYPTVRQLITHTSGYKGYYFESPMINNRLSGRNDFYGIGDSIVLNKIEKINLSENNYDFLYSNFGYAVLGLVLENVYQTEFTTLMNDFISENLELKNTKILDGTGDLENYWEWEPGDTYISAGAITSNIEDMLLYAQMQLEESHDFAQCHESIREINASSETNKLMEINMDEIAAGWIIDSENKIIWHNGGTGDYNCYLGFMPEEDCAVVILSNLPPDEKIPATVMGIKLLKELDNPEISEVPYGKKR